MQNSQVLLQYAKEKHLSQHVYELYLIINLFNLKFSFKRWAASDNFVY